MLIFETLLELDRDIVDWILQVSASTDAQRIALDGVVKFPGRLQDSINQLVAHQLELAAAELTDEASRLTAISQQMKQLERTIESVEKVLTIVGTGVEI